MNDSEKLVAMCLAGYVHPTRFTVDACEAYDAWLLHRALLTAARKAFPVPLPNILPVLADMDQRHLAPWAAVLFAAGFDLGEQAVRTLVLELAAVRANAAIRIANEEAALMHAQADRARAAYDRVGELADAATAYAQRAA